jgi:hypothetical protein
MLDVQGAGLHAERWGRLGPAARNFVFVLSEAVSDKRRQFGDKVSRHEVGEKARWRALGACADDVVVGHAVERAGGA